MLSNIVADIEMIPFLLKSQIKSLIIEFINEFERWKILLEEDGGNTKSIVLNDLQVYINYLKEALNNGTN